MHVLVVQNFCMGAWSRRSHHPEATIYDNDVIKRREERKKKKGENKKR